MSGKINTALRLKQRLNNRKRINPQNSNKNVKTEINKSEDLRKIDDLVNFIEGKEKKIEIKVKKITKQLEELKIEIDSKDKQNKAQQTKVKKEIKIKDLQKENRQVHKSKLNQNIQKKISTFAKAKPVKKKEIDKQVKGTKIQKTSHSNLQEHESSCTCTCSRNQNIVREARLKLKPIKEEAKNLGVPMLTIRRTMEPDPLVTITVKGSTPDEDKLLYTIVNGEVQLVEQEKVTKTQQKKKKFGNENQNEQLITDIINAEITRKILEQQNICLPPEISLTKIQKPSAQKSTYTSQASTPSNTPTETFSKISVIEIETSKLKSATSTTQENKCYEKVKQERSKKNN